MRARTSAQAPAPLAANTPAPTQEQPHEGTPQGEREGSPTPGPEICEGRNGTPSVDLTPWPSVAQRRAAAAIDCDAHEVMVRVWSNDLGRAKTATLYERVLALRKQALGELAANPIGSSRLPLSMTHRQMFGIAAEAERRASSGDVRVWAANAWRPLVPLERPSATQAAALSAAVMRGERRSIAFNIRSSRAAEERLRIRVEVPGLRHDAIHLHRVNWTGHDLSGWVAAELEPLGDGSTTYEIEVLPGVTQQLLVQLAPSADVEPGDFAGRVLIEQRDGTVLQIPVRVTVFRTQFPTHLSVHFAGWDYAEPVTDRRYGVRPENRAEVIDYLQSRHIDTAWGHARAVMHWRNIGPDGRLTGAIESSAMKAWVSEWTNARRFRVFLNAQDGIASIPETDENFPRAVATWARAWAAEIRRLGKSPEQFDISVVDEPHTSEAATTIERWSKAIRDSGSGFRIWTDPIWDEARLTPQSLIDAVDTVAINLGFSEVMDPAYWAWAQALARKGKTIEIYACDGPARRLDPYTYYRLTSWRAAFLGARTVSFWSLTYTGESPSDHEFAAGVGDTMQPYNYSPFFINSAEVRPGKQMEAAAEGIQDLEYLRMLREVADTHSRETVRVRARDLLDSSQAFISLAPRSTIAQWRLQPESTEADRLRISIAEFLDSIAL